MKLILPLLMATTVACSTVGVIAQAKPSGLVQRLDSSTLLVTYFGDMHAEDTTFKVPSSSGNYDTYLDMVGGDLASGERREIPCAIGTVSMGAIGNIVYEVAPGPGRPGITEQVKQGSERYKGLVTTYPGLKPGHLAPIRC